MIHSRYVLFATLLACPAHHLEAATGDLVSARIETNGWVLALTFEGLPTNGTFNFGFATNRVTSQSNAIVLSVNSMGYRDDTTAAEVPRRLYGTRQLRQPYPSQANDVQNSNGNAVARITVSDFIYSNCTNLQLTALGGFYTAGGKASNPTNISVVNDSIQTHQPTIAKWSWPPFWRITNDTYQVRMVAFHRSGQESRPVRAVKFWGVGSDGNTNEPVVVTMPSIDPSLGDRVPVVEYIATLDATPFKSSTTNALIWVTNHFAVYPWVGDENSMARTDNGTNVAPSPYPAPYPLLVERSNSAAWLTVAVVATNGSGNGQALRGDAFSPETPPAPFATINQAVAAIRQQNGLWYGSTRSNAGNAIIYLREGNHSWTGGVLPAGNPPMTWATVEAFPGVDWTKCVISNRAGTLGYASKSDRLRHLRISPTLGSLTFDNENLLWLDNCILDSTEDCIYRVTNVWVTASTLVTNRLQGLGSVSPHVSTFHLVRGNLLSPMSGPVQTHLVIGNLRERSLGGIHPPISFVENFGRPSKSTLLPVFAFNKLYDVAYTTGGPIIDWHKGNGSSMGATNDCQGMAIVQNLIEIAKSTQTGSPALAIAWGSRTEVTSNKVNNVLIWNNTILGARCNLGEDTAGSGLHNGIPNERYFWSVQNNTFASANTKHDDIYTPNGGRIYGWPVLYGVGWSGNLDQRLNVDCGWFFLCLGLHSYQFQTCDDARTNYPGYVDYRAFQGLLGDGSGGGNYDIATSSLAHAYGMTQAIPYDIDGRSRTPNVVDVGAYAFQLPAFIHFTSQTYANEVWQVSISGAPDGIATLEESTNLNDWALAGYVMIVNGQGTWSESIATNVPARFYRARF